ncbi:MAG: tripartite tricarboxylate transporter substrate binding protein, partial [Alphaproteobacteria bacterium]|nr:tripartite tricarboxylate transporter substrate binding protein [Alphaproteobacteria bacterium]
VAQAPADGSIFYATTPTYIQTTLLSKIEFGYDSLDPAVIVFLDPEVVYARAQSPFKTLAEAMDAAKKAPGKQRWGAANPASLERIALERLNRLTGAKAAVVSHEGGGDLMINVLNGTLDIGIGEIQEILPQLGAGQVRLLGTLTEKRLPRYPDLGTAREQGTDLVVTKFRGLAAPKGTPAAVGEMLKTAIGKVIERPDYKAKIAEESLVTALMGPAEAQAFTKRFAEEVGTSLRELGVVK